MRRIIPMPQPQPHAGRAFRFKKKLYFNKLSNVIKPKKLIISETFLKPNLIHFYLLTLVNRYFNLDLI